MKLFLSILLSVVFLITGIAGPRDEPATSKEDLLAELAGIDSSQEVQRYTEQLLHIASFLIEDSPQEGLMYFDKAEKYALFQKKPKPLILVYSQGGILMSRVGNYARSMHYYSKAAHLARISGQLKRISGWLEVDIGNLFFTLKNYPRAAEYYTRALSSFKRDSLDKGIAVVYNNLGLCALEIGKYPSALQFFKQGLAVRQSLEDTLLIAHSHLQLASAYGFLKQEERAEGLLDSALLVFREKNAFDFYHKALLDKAELQKKQGNYKAAIAILNRDRYLENSDKPGYYDPEEYLLRGQLQKLLGNYDQAEYFTRQGIQEAGSRNRLSALRTLLNELRLIYEVQNKNDQALAICRRVIALQDSTERSNNQALFELMEMQEELSEKASENLHLKELNRESLAEIKERGILLIASIIIISFLLVLIVVVFTQIRKRKKIEKRLLYTHQRIMAIMDNTTNIILSLDENGRIRLINKAGQKFYGQVLGTSIHTGDNFLSAVRRSGYGDLWNRIFEQVQKSQGWQEVTQVTLEGEVRYLFKSFSHIKNKKGRFSGLVMVGADFTDSRKKSLELEAQKEKLAQANAAKEKMLSILAHDLKDSIYSAKSLTDLVMDHQEEHDREELLEYFALLNTNFGKTKDLLMGLLDWVKTQTSGMKARPRSFSPYQLLNNVLESLEVKIQRKGVHIANRLDPDVKVWADQEMIRTVLRNLLSNAIKYTYPEKGKIEVWGEVLEEGLQIHLEDNGMGISEDDQRRLFDIPGRISTPGTADEPGTGFGLSLCQELLRLNDAVLKVSSKVGEGSDFYFTLPLSK